MPMKVLIVEDDIVIAITISEMVRDAGHHVLGPVATASAALAWAREENADFALLNIDLADGQKGTDLARTLRDELGVMSFFVSGNPAEAREAKDASYGYILKPFSESVVRGSLGVAEALRNGADVRQTDTPDGLVLFEQDA
jgi:two-component system, response regulator PdtaR